MEERLNSFVCLVQVSDKLFHVDRFIILYTYNLKPGAKPNRQNSHCEFYLLLFLIFLWHFIKIFQNYYEV